MRLNFFSSYLKKSDVGLEFGSGRSTLWFAKRIHIFYSVETDSIWFDKVKQAVNCNGIHNVTLIYLEDTSCLPEARQTDSKDILKYNEIIKMFQPDSLEFVLVDGANRSFCANAAIEIVKNGGIIIIDNAEWFIPSDSGIPWGNKIIPTPSILLNGANFLKRLRIIVVSGRLTAFGIPTYILNYSRKKYGKQKPRYSQNNACHGPRK